MNRNIVATRGSAVLYEWWIQSVALWGRLSHGSHQAPRSQWAGPVKIISMTSEGWPPSILLRPTLFFTPTDCLTPARTQAHTEVRNLWNTYNSDYSCSKIVMLPVASRTVTPPPPRWSVVVVCIHAFCWWSAAVTAEILICIQAFSSTERLLLLCFTPLMLHSYYQEEIRKQLRAVQPLDFLIFTEEESRVVQCSDCASSNYCRQLNEIVFMMVFVDHQFSNNLMWKHGTFKCFWLFSVQVLDELSFIF